MDDHPMTSDEFDAALESVVARTGVERYRHLTGDDNTLPAPNAPADWRAWVLREHRGEPHPAPPAVPVPVSYGGPTATRSCCGGSTA
jgi:hypothetical protein